MRLEGALDRQLLYAAAAGLARAIDRALVELPRPAAAGPAVEGCDLFEQVGVLCIGGAGSNRYTRDYGLLIDLGGDDIHANSAGGADLGIDIPSIEPPGEVPPDPAPLPDPPSGGNGLSASVTLDLGGNDRYETTVPSAGGSRAVQGGATPGTIGVLVDAGGNDVYSAVASIGDDEVDGFAHAQGVAIAGVGILADLAGDDRYEVLDPELDLTHHGGARALALGLGAAGAGGMALALDAGEGDDVAVIEARPETAITLGDGGPLSGGPALAGGFGLGSAAVGVFADDGGADSMRLDAATAPVASDEQRPLAVDIAFQAVPQGFGIGSLGGVGLSLGGVGPTRRTSSAEVRGPLTFIAATWVLGNGVAGGYGGVYDAGGDDLYLAESTTRTDASAVSTEDCDCGDAEAAAVGGAALADSIGYGFAGGIGVVHDVAGADEYRTRAEVETTALAQDERTNPPPEAAVRAMSVAGGAATASHGFGIGQGVGIVFDEDGHDAYLAAAQLVTSAAAESLTMTPRIARATGAGAAAYSMASSTRGGLGVLRDVGGADNYRATASVSGAASPPTQVSPGNPMARSQGSSLEGSSFLSDLDAGAADSFVSVPANPACFGTRGSGVWRDCASQSAGGIAA